MRSLLAFAAVALVASAATGYAQEKAQPEKTETTKAMYMVRGLH